MAYASWSVVFGETPSASKWNILGTNDASFNDGTGIAVSAITPEKLLTGTGTSWVWQTWTPTWTNVTVGNGTLSASYRQIGKAVVFRLTLQLGSTSSVGTAPTFTLPVTAINSYFAGAVPEGGLIGTGKLLDSGTANFHGFVKLESTTTGKIQAGGVSATYLTNADLQSNIPFVWGTGDALFAQGIYEAA